MYTVVIWNWAVTYGIGESGALRSDGFQKIPARPQIVFNMFTCLNMLECFTTVIKIIFSVGRVIWHTFFQFLKALVKKQSKESA